MLETWEPVVAPVKIRIRVFQGSAGFLPCLCFFYSVESRVTGWNRWHELAEWRVDDPIPRLGDHVLFVGDRVACVFFREQYILTTDGGRTWSKWYADWALPSLKWPNIVDVKLDQTGRGTLVVSYAMRVNEHEHGTMTLKTTDYGVHWATTN